MPSLNRLTSSCTRPLAVKYLRALWLMCIVCFGTCSYFIRAHAQTPEATLTEADVSGAIQQLKQDPNLAPERTTKILQWVRNNEKDTTSDSTLPSWLRWLRWIGDLFQWLADSSRVLLWTVIIIGVALLALFLLRLVRRTGGDSRIASAAAPTHVRELDIRPESLPDNIGEAAWTLWARNEHRAALALLYRGLLSRLVHGYTVQIRASSTELDCQRLASTKLDTERMHYVIQVLNVWRNAVYGGIEPSTEHVRQLCTGFATLAASNRDEPIASGVPT